MQEIMRFFEQLTNSWWGILIIVIAAVLIWIAISALFYRIFFKRFYDILLSGIALILLSPIIAIVAILVRVKLGSPVIFAQARPLKKGKIKNIHKFRTMTDARDANGNLLPDLERLPSFGKFLRSTSLDELPQLWDIFIGRISIVGPRPLLIRYLPLYSEEQAKRHNVRPGLTGLAQVNGRNRISWEMKFNYDVQYVKKVSLWLDIKIILLTVIKVFNRKDINQNEGTTMTEFRGNGKKLAIYCAGGLGKELLDLAKRNNNGRWQEIFFVDDMSLDKSLNGTPIIKFDEIKEKKEQVEFVIGNGEPFLRESLSQKVTSNGYELAIIIDKTAIVSETAKIGRGSIVSPNCFVSSNTVIGESCYLQPVCNVGHDSILGDFSVLSSFVTVCGHCNLGKCVYVGVNVPIRENVIIGEGTIIGLGSAVLRDIPANMIALGNPARPMKENETKRVFNK